MSKKIRVLVVDDSLVFREILSRGISSDPDIEVVAKAVDPYDARDKILEYEPDVMTCDIEMPKMNGIDFIRKLLPQYQLPVIVVSTISDAVFDAMDAGAVDFVTKPDANSPEDVKSFIENLINKVKIADQVKVDTLKNKTQKQLGTKNKNDSKNKNYSNQVIAVGASTGGTKAISDILESAPTNGPGIVIAQHIPPVFSKMFADRLNESTEFRVKEAKTGDFIEPGTVLIAPGDKHMKVRKVGSRYSVECFDGEKVSGHKPSIDVLFESVAKVYKDKAIGVILTGMGYDGAKGLLSMRKNGAKTIGQDEKSSIVYGMPKVAYNIGAVTRQSSLDKIPKTISSFL